MSTLTTQEKIRQLAAQALRTVDPEIPARPLAARPKIALLRPAEMPAMPVASAPEEPPSVVKASAPVPVGGSPVVEVAAVPAAVTPAASQDEVDVGVLIEERNKRLKRTWAWRRRTLSLAALAMLSAGGVWYAKSPALQAKIQLLGENFRKGKQDLKTLGSIVQTYQKEAEKVKVRGEQIDHATTELGVDPKSAANDADPNMEKEMKQMMGPNAITPAERNRLLQQKFGGVKKLFGNKEDPAPTAQASPSTR